MALRYLAKGTVSVISNYLLFKEGHSRFTTVPCTPILIFTEVAEYKNLHSNIRKPCFIQNIKGYRCES